MLQGASQPTKVVVVIPGLEVGGAEQDILRNFPRVDRTAFSVVVVSFSGRGALGPELERLGIRVVARLEQEAEGGATGSPPGRPSWRPRGIADVLLRPIRRAVAACQASALVGSMQRRAGTLRYIANVTLWLRRTLAAEQAEIVHFFLPSAYLYGMAATLFVFPRPKCVMSRLSLNFYKDTHRIAWRVERVLHRIIDVAVGNSGRILDELMEEGVSAGRLRLLYNGIDYRSYERRDGDRARVRKELKLDASAFVMLAVGNLHIYKGHGDLIDACALARRDLPEGWRLVLAGKDSSGHQQRYAQQVADLQLTDRVCFLGGRDDVGRLLLAADVLVHPSHHEGLPNAIIEAMAASLPVVATHVGGIPELVIPHQEPQATGWLVPPRDPAALAAALVAAAGDEEGRIAMGGRGRARVVTHFSLERSVRTYEAIYHELVPGRMREAV